MFEAGRTTQVAKKMKNYMIGVLGLSETRWLQTGQLGLSSGEQLLYSRHTEDGAPHTESVALMLAPEAQRALVNWEPVNSRIITAKFITKKKDIKLNIIQCYTPTNDAEEEKKDEFYQQLLAVIDKGGAKDHKTENQIDHICISQKFRRSWRDVRVMRGTDVSSDHHLVTTTMRLRLKKRYTNAYNTQTRYNVGLLRNKDA